MAELFPKGNYLATVLEHGFGKTPSGSEQFVVKFDTEAGVITGYFSLAETVNDKGKSAADYTMGKIRAMGFNGDDLGELAEGDLLAGNKCDITVEHDTYQGKTKAKVGFVNPVGGGAIKKDPSVNVKRFNALLRKAPKVTEDTVPSFA